MCVVYQDKRDKFGFYRTRWQRLDGTYKCGTVKSLLTKGPRKLGSVQDAACQNENWLHGLVETYKTEVFVLACNTINTSR